MRYFWRKDIFDSFPRDQRLQFIFYFFISYLTFLPLSNFISLFSFSLSFNIFILYYFSESVDSFVVTRFLVTTLLVTLSSYTRNHKKSS